MAYAHELVNYIFDFIQKNKDSNAIYMYATVVEPQKMYLQNRQYSSWRDLDNATQLSDILDTNYIYVFPGDTLEFSFPTFNLNNKTYISVLLRTYANIQPIINYENWVEGRNGIFRGYIELNSFDELLPTAGNYIKILPEWVKWEKYRSLPFYEAKQLYELGYINSNQNINNDFNNLNNMDQITVTSNRNPETSDHFIVSDIQDEPIIEFETTDEPDEGLTPDDYKPNRKPFEPKSSGQTTIMTDDIEKNVLQEDLIMIAPPPIEYKGNVTNNNNSGKKILGFGLIIWALSELF